MTKVKLSLSVFNFHFYFITKVSCISYPKFRVQVMDYKSSFKKHVSQLKCSLKVKVNYKKKTILFYLTAYFNFLKIKKNK